MSNLGKFRLNLSDIDNSTITFDAQGRIQAAGGAVDIQTITGNDALVNNAVAGNMNLIGTATNGVNVTKSVAGTEIIGMNSPFADGDFAFQNATGGAQRIVYSENTTDAVGSAASFFSRVAGSLSQDTWYQWAVNNVRHYAAGIDNSDSDRWKITTDVTLVNPSTGTTLMTVDPASNAVTFTNVYVGSVSPSNAFDISVEKSVAGLIGQSIQNTSANAAAGAVQELITAGGGDVFTEYVSASNTYSAGLDTSSGSYKVTNGANPSSGTDLMAITASSQTFPDLRSTASASFSGTLQYDGISAGYAGSEQQYRQAGVQTTDATVTSIATILVNQGEMIAIQGLLNGFRSTFAEAISCRFFASARRATAGNIILIGTPIIEILEDSSGAPNMQIDADTGTQTIRLRVQGETSKTFNWVVTYDYFKTLTNS